MITMILWECISSGKLNYNDSAFSKGTDVAYLNVKVTVNEDIFRLQVLVDHAFVV